MTSKISEPRSASALASAAGRLLHAEAVRGRAHQMLELAQHGGLEEWTVDLDRLSPTADFVAATVRSRYPQLQVPVHSRWRHFEVRGQDLWSGIVAGARWRTPQAAARAAFDLVITSVLLDAGAGTAWRYRDQATQVVAGRSEGLALASLRWFESGGLSLVPGDPYRVDGAALRRVDRESLQAALQAGENNTLPGLDGRAALLNRLGAVTESRPDLFAIADAPRPGGLFDALAARAVEGRLPAPVILDTLLEALGPIWEDRPSLGGVPLGDCWPHPALKGPNPDDRYVPLHKLSQWLSYSLIEPLQSAGIEVRDVERLTGLAEYRNGGLFVDMSVLAVRDAAAVSRSYPVADPLIVGWRAMTVALLDRLAPMVGSRLGLTPEEFPLARMLEGGTWAAGRLIAGQKRADGGPPFKVLSDGTVF